MNEGKQLGSAELLAASPSTKGRPNADGGELHAGFNFMKSYPYLVVPSEKPPSLADQSSQSAGNAATVPLTLLQLSRPRILATTAYLSELGKLWKQLFVASRIIV